MCAHSDECVLTSQPVEIGHAPPIMQNPKPQVHHKGHPPPKRMTEGNFTRQRMLKLPHKLVVTDTRSHVLIPLFLHVHQDLRKLVAAYGSLRPAGLHPEGNAGSGHSLSYFLLWAPRVCTLLAAKHHVRQDLNLGSLPVEVSTSASHDFCHP